MWKSMIQNVIACSLTLNLLVLPMQTTSHSQENFGFLIFFFNIVFAYITHKQKMKFQHRGKKAQAKEVCCLTKKMLAYKNNIQ